MTRNSRLLILAAAVLALGLSASLFYRHKYMGSAEVPGFLRSRALRGFKLAERSEQSSADELVFTNRQSVLKIDIVRDVDAKRADTLEKDGMTGLGGLFASARSSFPGDISSKVVTDARYRPQLFREVSMGRTNSYFILFANARFEYGALTPQEVEYTSLVGWKYCAKVRNFYKVRYFMPIKSDTEELHRLFKSFECPRAAEAAGKY